MCLAQYIPQMEYLLIDLSQFADTDLEKMDGLVAAITYAENHGKTAEFASLLAELGQYIHQAIAPAGRPIQTLVQRRL